MLIYLSIKNVINDVIEDKGEIEGILHILLYVVPHHVILTSLGSSRKTLLLLFR